MKNLKTVYKWLGWSLLLVLLFTGLCAAGVLMLGQWTPDGFTTIHFGDEVITLADGVALGGASSIAIWLIVTLALTVSFFAVVFALGLAALVLFTVGLLLASPVLAVIVVIWLLARHFSKRDAQPHAASPAPAATI